MKKENEFIKNLDLELEKSSIQKKKRDAIVLKYQKKFKLKVEKGEKIDVILDRLGSPKDVALYEINKINKKKNNSKKEINKIPKTSEIIKQEVISSEKVNTKKAKKENKKTVKKVLNEKISNIFNKIKIFINKMKDTKITINNKKEKKVISKIENNNDIKVNNEEIVNLNEQLDDKEQLELDNEVEETEEIIVVKNKYKSKKERILNAVITTIIILIWQWSCVITFATMFAVLDGVKISGIFILSFGISLLLLWLVILTINKFYNKLLLGKIKHISLIIILSIISLGIGLLIFQIIKIDKVSDLSEKFSMTTKTETYSMPKGENTKMYIIFNANYDTQYIVNYDDELDDKFKVEVNYYEAYYDYYSKKSSNNIYISLREDKRDILSTYINGLKENKIYSDDELYRYVVRITISKKDYERLVIED